jgi:predicted secreted hydrolase
MRVRNPSNIQMKSGKLSDKYGRVFKIDWKLFDKKRKKKEINVTDITILK